MKKRFLTVLPLLLSMVACAASAVMVRAERKTIDFDNLPANARLFFFSTKGKKCLWDIKFEKDDYLIFGSESCGLPRNFYTKYADKLYTIPMPGDVRSLNLSTSAAICLYEALRQTRKL